MDKIKLGIIGVGGMGSGHARNMAGVEEVDFVAVADVNPAAVKEAVAKFGVKGYASATELIDSGTVDAVLIATPHYDHPIIAMQAMRAGIHVYSEKPMAVRLSRADEMIQVAKETGMLLQVGFNTRATPIVQTAKRIVQEGRLGEIYRTLLISSNFRSQAYYDSATWRATWRGEGGGVLMNQSPHDLDRFVMLAGLPSRVSARANTRRHRIEVEDEASAMLEYPNGATGFVHVSVCEAPGGNRLEVLGEKGKLVMAERGIRLWEIPQGIQNFSDETDEMWSRPETKEVEVEVPERTGSGHADLVANFARAILHGEELLCPGEAGIGGLELADAILYSGFTGKAVDVPLDRAEFDGWLAEKQTTSEEKRISGPDKRVTDPHHL